MINNNYGCFLVTILPPSGGVPYTLYLEIGKETEAADLIAASARVRHIIQRCLKAGELATPDVRK